MKRNNPVRALHPAALPPPRAGNYPGRWVGRFIWDHGESVPFHCFLMCRKTFDLPLQPQQARVHIAAADKYILYVNGEYVGRGPCRSVGPDWTCFDTRDVTALLHRGRNVIAVKAYYYGCPNSFSHDQRAGLFVQVESLLPDGCVTTVGTDETWKVRPLTGYRRDVELGTHLQGIPIEVYEAGHDPEEWTKTDFDDQMWDNALALMSVDRLVEHTLRSCWSYLEPRLTPLLDERKVFAERIVAVGEAIPPEAGAFKDVQVAERLDADKHVPLRAGEATGIAGLTAPGAGAKFVSRGGRDPFIILDFGKPHIGIPRIVFEAAKGAVIEMTYGLKLKDGRVLAVNPANYARWGDRYVAREGLQTWEHFEAKTAMRYLQIVFRTGGTPIRVREVVSVAQEYPVVRRGAFACSDQALTTLWQAAVDTVLLHLEDVYLNDPVRERAAYMLCGELEHSHLAYYASVGDIAATDVNFKYTTRSQLASGALSMFVLGERADGFHLGRQPVNSISCSSYTPYSVFFAQAVLNRHRYFAKPGFLEEHYPTLVRIAQWIERQTDPDTGLMDNIRPLCFLDWPTTCKWRDNGVRGANFGQNALCCKMYEDMGEIASCLGKESEAQQWREKARVIKDVLRSSYWNASRGLYVDVLVDRKPIAMYSELLNALAILYAIATPDQVPGILEHLMHPDPDLTRVSPLYFSIVLEALISAGADSYAYRYMAERYAWLASMEFPRLSENWPDQVNGNAGLPASEGSAIHGSGAGVAWTLSQHVLGIKPVKPGFAEVVFDPRPGDLQWAKGVLPTPHGDIRVEWKRDAKGRIVSKIKAPAGVKVIKEVPRAVRATIA
jgi:hypothetical protein